MSSEKDQAAFRQSNPVGKGPKAADKGPSGDSDAEESPKGWRRFAQPWLAALLISLAVGTILYLRYPNKFSSYTAQIPHDFGVYVKAWQRYVQGENPYVASEYSAFKYAPGMLALIGILPKAPTDAWFAFSLLCIAGLSASLMIGARYRSWRDVVALALGVILSWKGILETLDYGQVELFIFPILIGATAIYTRQTLLSGALVGLLPWIKLPLLFMIVPFFFASSRREREDGKPPLRRLKLFFSGFLFSSVFWGAALPSLAFGPDKALMLSQSWYSLIRDQPQGLFDSPLNQSLWASLGRWVEAPSSMMNLGLAGVLSGLLLGLLILRRPYAPTAQDSFVWITPWLIMGHLVNPLSWRWGSAYLLGVCFAAFRPGRQFLWFRGLLWIGVLGLFLLQQNPFVKGVLGLNHWTDLHEMGVITVYWLVLLLLSI